MDTDCRIIKQLKLFELIVRSNLQFFYPPQKACCGSSIATSVAATSIILVEIDNTISPSNVMKDLNALNKTVLQSRLHQTVYIYNKSRRSVTQASDFTCQLVDLKKIVLKIKLM